jgi:hypothetical protein
MSVQTTADDLFPASDLPGLGQLHWLESTEPTAPDPLVKIVAALQTGEVARPPEPWRAINPRSMTSRSQGPVPPAAPQQGRRPILGGTERASPRCAVILVPLLQGGNDGHSNCDG